MPYKNDDLLRKKHGLSDPRANYAIEITDRYLIKHVNDTGGVQNIKNLRMRRHFERKMAFTEKFDTQESYTR